MKVTIDFESWNQAKLRAITEDFAKPRIYKQIFIEEFRILWGHPRTMVVSSILSCTCVGWNIRYFLMNGKC